MNAVQSKKFVCGDQEGTKGHWGQGRLQENVFASLSFPREFRNKAMSLCAPSRWAGEETQVEYALEKWPETGSLSQGPSTGKAERTDSRRGNEGGKEEIAASRLSVGIKEKK